MKGDQQQSRLDPEVLCLSCVYFSRNLDKTECLCADEKQDCCGLGFIPGDESCTEMRTDNCSTRKK